MEEAHHCDIQAVQAEVYLLSERIDTSESSISSLEHQVTALERSHVSQVDTAVDLQLHLKDLEDRSRRNNLWLWGPPEGTGTEDLSTMVNAIFQKVLASPPTNVELTNVDQAYRPQQAPVHGLSPAPLPPEGVDTSQSLRE